VVSVDDIGEDDVHLRTRRTSMTDAPIEQRPGSSATTAVEPPLGATSMPTPVPATGGGASGSPEQTTGTVSTIAHETAAHGGDLAHEAVGEVKSVVGTATDQARSLAGTARQHLGREADDAAGRAADAIAGTAHDLTALARGEGGADSPAADVVRQIGERVEQVADRLRDGGYQGVMDDVSRWARAHPGTFLLAAAGTGFALGRIFRTVDTGAVVDATRRGAQPDDGGSSGSGAFGSSTAHDASAIGGQTMGTDLGGPDAFAAPAPPIDLTEDPAWRPAADPASQPAGGASSEVRP
jgi:hypothetical protein